MTSAVQSVIASFTDILEKQQIRLTYTCSLTNTDIFIDPAKLRQVLINLIKNAIEAVEKNGDILIHVYCVDNNAVISIEDNGCGIQSPENIFDPFYTTKPQGTGLGLPFCQEIALIHEGSLSFDISERGYTRFLLTLPLLCT